MRNLGVAVLSAGVVAAFAGVPAGTIYTSEVTVYGGGRSDKITTACAIVLPSPMDDRGTATLVLSGRHSSQFVQLDKQNAPEELQFAFGEVPSVFLGVNDKILSANARSGFEFIIAEFPYDKSAPIPVPPKLRIVDAAGNPVPDDWEVVDSVSLEGVQLENTVDQDGNLTWPAFIIDGQRGAATAQSVYRQITVKDGNTGQTFIEYLGADAISQLTELVVPNMQGPVPAGFESYKVRILKNDKTPATDVRVGVATSSQDSNTTETTEVYNAITPGADGTVNLVVSPEMGMMAGSHNEIFGYIAGTTSTLFAQDFILQPGDNPDIVLPKRVSFAGQLIDSAGVPVDLRESQPGSVSQSYVAFHRVTADRGRFPRFRPAPLRLPPAGADAEPTAFDIPDLPVPGSYFVMFQDKKYGPVEVGETSATQLIQFREVKP